MLKSLMEIAHAQRETVMIGSTHAQTCQCHHVWERSRQSTIATVDEIELLQSMQFQAKCSGEVGTPIRRLWGWKVHLMLWILRARFYRRLGLKACPVSPNSAV